MQFLKGDGQLALMSLDTSQPPPLFKEGLRGGGYKPCHILIWLRFLSRFQISPTPSLLKRGAYRNHYVNGAPVILDTKQPAPLFKGGLRGIYKLCHALIWLRFLSRFQISSTPSLLKRGAYNETHYVNETLMCVDMKFYNTPV